MEVSSSDSLPSIVANAESISQKLREIERGARPVAFSHVTEPAQAFLVAAIAGKIQKTSWILCPNVRSQELLYESLLNWLPNALFLPEAEFAAVENILPDPEIAAERLALLNRVQRAKDPHLIVTTRAALDQAAPDPAGLNSAVLALRRGKREPMERTIEALVAAGYERVAQATTRGQFAVRGGILDVFSWQAQRPIRAEYFGDDIESLREFDVDTQTSVRSLQSVEILLEAAEDQTATVRDYVAADHLQVDIEPEETGTTADILIGEGWLGGTASVIGILPMSHRLEADATEDFRGAFDQCDIGDFAVGDFMLVEAKRAQFSARLRDWRAAEFRIVIYFQTEGEIERFREIMGDAVKGIDLVEGTLPRGFVFPDGQLVVLSGAELFGRYTAHGRRRLQRAEKLSRNRAQIDFSELNEGDLVVHLEHGVGRFLQLTRVPSPAGEMQEALALEFANDSRLYVPLEQAYLVSRYVGVGKKSPPLSSLADAKWARAKKNAVASIFDYAGKMLAVQAERETQLGHAFGPTQNGKANSSIRFRSAKRRTSSPPSPRRSTTWSCRARWIASSAATSVSEKRKSRFAPRSRRSWKENRSPFSRRRRSWRSSISKRSGNACSIIRCGSKCSAVSVRTASSARCSSFSARAASTSSSARTGSSRATSFSRISAWS